MTETATLTWDDIDLKARIIRVPSARTKSGRKLDLPMSVAHHERNEKEGPRLAAGAPSGSHRIRIVWHRCGMNSRRRSPSMISTTSPTKRACTVIAWLASAFKANGLISQLSATVRKVRRSGAPSAYLP